jgi:hypothetical protein
MDRIMDFSAENINNIATPDLIRGRQSPSTDSRKPEGGGGIASSLRFSQ